MAVIVVQRITPTILTTIRKTAFGFGALKLGVTPAGGVANVTVAARKDARLAYVAVVVVAEVAIIDDIIGMTEV